MVEIIFGPVISKEGPALQLICKFHEDDDPTRLIYRLGDMTPQQALKERFSWVESYMSDGHSCTIHDDEPSWDMMVRFLEHYGMETETE